MTNFDIEYLKLLKKILKEGVEVENRTGVNTIKIPKYNFEFDLGKEFPILTTKQTFYKNAIIEMLWIWQEQSNNVKFLHDRNVHIWDEWMIDEDGIYRIYEPDGKCDYEEDREVIVLDPLSTSIKDPFGPLKPKYDDKGNIMKAKSLIPGKTIKTAKYYGKEYANTIGTAYGFITNRYGLTQNIINKIKNDPTDRRIVGSLWQNEFLRTAVLPSCVWSTEWDVTDGKLNLLVHQRSCDTPLGLPFNVTQYATFLKMIANVTGLEPGVISYSIKDAHIYVNQIEGIKEQIEREKLYNKYKKESERNLLGKYYNNEASKVFTDYEEDLKKIETENRIIDMILNPTKPELLIDKNVEDFFDYDNSRELKHVKVKNYKHMGKINFNRVQ